MENSPSYTKKLKAQGVSLLLTQTPYEVFMHFGHKGILILNGLPLPNACLLKIKISPVWIDFNGPVSVLWVESKATLLGF